MKLGQLYLKFVKPRQIPVKTLQWRGRQEAKMAELKIATFNVEWMISIFGGLWNEWNGTIPDRFPKTKRGEIQLEAIEDVPALCKRIGGVIKKVDPDILAIQEGPPLKKQMELLCA
jgi:hypothetical protein